MVKKPTKKANKPKNKGGRPTKYKSGFVQIAGELCQKKGYTDKNLAVHFKVSENTINDWKKRFPEFLESLKKGKDEFDTQVVEQALLKRATGYTYNEITKEPYHEDDGEEGDVVAGVLVVTKIVKKEIAPDVTAQIFWLKNRQPQRWSDKKEIEHGVTAKLGNLLGLIDGSTKGKLPDREEEKDAG